MRGHVLAAVGGVLGRIEQGLLLFGCSTGDMQWFRHFCASYIPGACCKFCYNGAGGVGVGLQEHGLVCGAQGLCCVASTASFSAGLVRGRCLVAIRAGCLHVSLR